MRVYKLLTIPLMLGMLFLNSCSKDDDSSEPTKKTPTPTPTTSQYHFKATIGGETVAFNQGVNGYINGAGSTSDIGAGETVENQFTEFYQLDGNFVPIEENSVSVIFVKHYLTTAFPSSSQIDDMFKLGMYDFGDRGAAVEGVVIEYHDENGKLWSSGEATWLQSGSNFELTFRSEHDGTSTNIKTSATFNCKLYSGINGDEHLVLTNGEYTGLTGNY